jgi:hypothetical protein
MLERIAKARARMEADRGHTCRVPVAGLTVLSTTLKSETCVTVFGAVTLQTVRMTKVLIRTAGGLGETRHEPALWWEHISRSLAPVKTRQPLRRRLIAFAFTGCGLAMVPWLAVLFFYLPSTSIVPHWNVAWVGLDAIEAVGLFTTGRLLARGDRRYAITATLTGTALLVDAWFDILTSGSRTERLAAVAMAGIELPLSGLCYFLALRAVPGHSRL